MPAPVMKPRGFRQARCSGCGLTAGMCICASHARLESSIAISVVMTRSEARSASNSARLLQLWLPHVALHVYGRAGARTDPEALVARPGSALLFPGAAPGVPLPSDVRHLIVPDGTWTQARRIERRCFATSGLPLISLDGNWPSAYGLRRGREGAGSEPCASSDGSSNAGSYAKLCTFEATALALGLLDRASLARVLLERFVDWVRRAQRLKAGGGSLGPETRSPLAGEPHPAMARLRTLAGR
jgi:DTW domain-containing protein